ncbi:hypothetical protein LCGC14_2125990, partial [marine sediment metagenome]
MSEIELSKKMAYEMFQRGYK